MRTPKWTLLLCGRERSAADMLFGTHWRHRRVQKLAQHPSKQYTLLLGIVHITS